MVGRDQPAIVGVGYAGFAPMTPHLSYKELMYEAATRAFADAGVDPRRDVESWVCSTEDLWEGNSIADEYMPDQLGAALRPLCTVSGDALQALATGYMQIRTGLVKLAVVEAHSKLSDVLSKEAVEQFAYDPLFHRPLDLHAWFLAGLEMQRYLVTRRLRREDVASIVAANRRQALHNPRASYGARIDPTDVLRAPIVAEPLTEAEVARPADVAIVFLLASANRARRLTDRPVWIEGVGWNSGSPWPEDRDMVVAEYVAAAAKMAYRAARIQAATRSFDLVELDDTFAYKELQHAEALQLAAPGDVGRLVRAGRLGPEGDPPVNPSGGSLGVGYFVEATGAHRLLEAVLQLRGDAGGVQVDHPRRALVQSWRGLPTATAAVTVLGN